MNIPTLGWVRIKEKVIYQQLKTDGKSKAVQYPSKQTDTMSVLIEIPDVKITNNKVMVV